VKKVLKRLIQNTLAFGPLPRLIQRLKQEQGAVTLLTYHSIIDQPLPFDDWCFLDSARFEQQLRYLSQHFRLVSMSEACAVLSGEQQAQGDKPLAVITFDDGYQNNFDIALPLLEKYQAPAMIYLVSDLIASERNFWFTRLLQALSVSQASELRWGHQGNERSYPLTNSEDKARSCAQLQAALKALPSESIIEAVEEIEKRLGVETQDSVEPGSPFRMLDQPSLDALHAHPLIEFGAHTHSHHILSRLDSRVKAQEINHSVDAVSALAGRRCEHFAFPNGAPQDYDQESIDLLRAAGIKSAVTMSPGPARPGDNLLKINRYPIGTDTRFPRFKLMVHHIV